MRELAGRDVAARLERLRAIYVAEDADEARRRLAQEHRRRESLAEGAGRRLAELRALCDLTAHLQPRRVRTAP